MWCVQGRAEFLGLTGRDLSTGYDLLIYSPSPFIAHPLHLPLIKQLSLPYISGIGATNNAGVFEETAAPAPTVSR